MKISPVTNLNYSYNIKQSKNEKKLPLLSNHLNTKNISFKNLTPAETSIYVSKLVLLLRKKYNQIKNIDILKKDIFETLSNIEKNKDVLPAIMLQLSKFSINLDKVFLYNIFGDNNPEITIEKLKNKILTSGLQYLDDTKLTNRFIKKDFLENSIKFQEHKSQAFIEAFKNLDNTLYGDFKINIAENILSSPIRVKSREKDPNLFLYDKKLIETLEPKFYKNFYTQNCEEIKNLMIQFDKLILDIFKSNKNCAYNLYCHEFNIDSFYYNNVELKGEDWAKDIENVFTKVLVLNNGNLEAQEKFLNIEEPLLKEIILDLVYLGESEDVKNTQKKWDILAARLLQKIDRFKNNSNMEDALNILNFINKTSFPDKNYPEIFTQLDRIKDKAYNPIVVPDPEPDFDFESYDRGHGF